MRQHSGPPQGTSRIFNADEKEQIERLVERSDRQWAARSQDPDLQILDEALRRKDLAVLRGLLPILKERYGCGLWKLNRGLKF